MNINNYDKEIDWDKVKRIIDSHIEEKFSFIDNFKMNELHPYFNLGIANLNMSLDNLVTGLLRDNLCIIHFNCVDLLRHKDGLKMYIYEKETRTLLAFLGEIGYELNAKINLVNKSVSFNLKKDKLAFQKVNAENVLNAYETSGLNKDNIYLKTGFVNKLSGSLSSLVTNLTKQNIDNIKLDMNEIRKIVDDVVYESSRRVVMSEDIFVKSEEHQKKYEMFYSIQA